uniref:GDSL esterase/lipase At1g74460-like n=1 Tax=Fragaria vesca subsp. vesca TaxID=101020 RepID=UPI0005CA6D73
YLLRRIPRKCYRVPPARIHRNCDRQPDQCAPSKRNYLKKNRYFPLLLDELWKESNIRGPTSYASYFFLYHVQGIYDLGGRKRAFQNAGPIGCLPYAKQSSDTQLVLGCVEGLQTLARQHNKALASVLKELESQLPGFKYSIFEYYDALGDRVLNPNKYGMLDQQYVNERYRFSITTYRILISCIWCIVKVLRMEQMRVAVEGRTEDLIVAD